MVASDDVLRSVGVRMFVLRISVLLMLADFIRQMNWAVPTQVKNEVSDLNQDI